MEIANTLLKVTKENIFKFISPDDIYKYYLSGKLVYNRAFSSPFREDKKPSFIIYNKTYSYRDFATGEFGDCISFVMTMYNFNFYQALEQIIYDFNLNSKFILKNNKTSTKKLTIKNVVNKTSSNDKAKINVKVRKFEEYDFEYWNSYGISFRFLKLANIYAISHYYINNVLFVAEKYAYVYVEKKDNKTTFKIYQPFSKKKKWLNGNDFSTWELWHLLPDQGDKLIITSSRKDALSIFENSKMTISSTSLQAETIMPKKQIIDDLKSRFKDIYLLYDNDKAGIKFSNQIAKKYNLKNIIIPEKYNSKDFSDLVFNFGRGKSIIILNDILNEKT